MHDLVEKTDRLASQNEQVMKQNEQLSKQVERLAELLQGTPGQERDGRALGASPVRRGSSNAQRRGMDALPPPDIVDGGE